MTEIKLLNYFKLLSWFIKYPFRFVLKNNLFLEQNFKNTLFLSKVCQMCFLNLKMLFKNSF